MKQNKTKRKRKEMVNKTQKKKDQQNTRESNLTLFLPILSD